MNQKVLLGRGRGFLEIPQSELERHLTVIPEHRIHRLSFMTAGHHRVRDYCVMQLARVGVPLSPESIARDLSLSLSRVIAILNDLEKHLFFLVRKDRGISYTGTETTRSYSGQKNMRKSIADQILNPTARICRLNKPRSLLVFRRERCSPLGKGSRNRL